MPIKINSTLPRNPPCAVKCGIFLVRYRFLNSANLVPTIEHFMSLLAAKYFYYFNEIFSSGKCFMATTTDQLFLQAPKKVLQKNATMCLSNGIMTLETVLITMTVRQPVISIETTFPYINHNFPILTPTGSWNLKTCISMSKSVLLPANPLAETYFHSSVNFTVKFIIFKIVYRLNSNPQGMQTNWLSHGALSAILIREMLSDSRQRDQSIWISQIGFVEVCGASRS